MLIFFISFSASLTWASNMTNHTLANTTDVAPVVFELTTSQLFKVCSYSLNVHSVCIRGKNLLSFQTIGSGFVIAPLLGLVETIAIGKAFGLFHLSLFNSRSTSQCWPPRCSACQQIQDRRQPRADRDRHRQPRRMLRVSLPRDRKLLKDSCQFAEWSENSSGRDHHGRPGDDGARLPYISLCLHSGSGPRRRHHHRSHRHGRLPTHQSLVARQKWDQTRFPTFSVALNHKCNPYRNRPHSVVYHIHSIVSSWNRGEVLFHGI